MVMRCDQDPDTLRELKLRFLPTDIIGRRCRMGAIRLQHPHDELRFDDGRNPSDDWRRALAPT